MGGNDGYVTPAANPCKIRSAKTIHRFCFDATGMINVMIAPNNVVDPNTILVPIFSAKVPPNIWKIMYP